MVVWGFIVVSILTIGLTRALKLICCLQLTTDNPFAYVPARCMLAAPVVREIGNSKLIGTVLVLPRKPPPLAELAVNEDNYVSNVCVAFRRVICEVGGKISLTDSIGAGIFVSLFLDQKIDGSEYSCPKTRQSQFAPIWTLCAGHGATELRFFEDSGISWCAVGHIVLGQSYPMLFDHVGHVLWTLDCNFFDHSFKRFRIGERKIVEQSIDGEIR